MTDVSMADIRFRATSVWSDVDSPVVTVIGRIESATAADELSRHLRHLFTFGARYLLVDLSAVESCNQYGLKALLAAREEARLRQGWLCVRGSSSLLDELTGFRRQPADGYDAPVAC